MLLDSLLNIGLPGTASVRASALRLQDKNHKALQMAINADTQEMEKSITTLQDSLTSLEEVVLQKRPKLAVPPTGRTLCSLR